MRAKVSTYTVLVILHFDRIEKDMQKLEDDFLDRSYKILLQRKENAPSDVGNSQKLDS